jgi:hypothetical protein
MTAPNDMAVRRALESAGVEFIDERWPRGAAAKTTTQKELRERVGGSAFATTNEPNLSRTDGLRRYVPVRAADHHSCPTKATCSR